MAALVWFKDQDLSDIRDVKVYLDRQRTRFGFQGLFPYLTLVPFVIRPARLGIPH